MDVEAPARPALLADRLAPDGLGLVLDGACLGCPHHWQVPAATEKAAYEAMAARTGSLDFDYVGFPWATVIDGVRSDAAATWDLLAALDRLRADLGTRPARRRATVVQHIHAARFADLFRALGVTDLFWTHARHDQPEIGGVRVHPFPLYPAQTPDGPEPGDVHRPRRWLANFVGAYNPKVYLTDMRQRIFEDAGRADDLLIVRREAWHFDRAVYAEQMKGMAPDDARLALEAQHKAEYLDAIRDSAFTLCPTGSGPNSIRIGEALALGSIPVILTRALALPGDPALWDAACLFETDTAEGYTRALAAMRAMPEAELRSRQSATRELFAAIGPNAYADLVAAAMAPAL